MTAYAIPTGVVAEVDDMLDTVNRKVVEFKAFALVLYMAVSYEPGGLDSEQRLALEIVLGRAHDVASEAVEAAAKARAT